MAKKITKEEIYEIPKEALVELVYTQLDNDTQLYEKIEKLLLKSDQNALVRQIRKEIGSVRRGRKFIDYYDAFKFAEKVESIVDDITLMVEDGRVASTLYKELILTDGKVYERSDDSAGAIQLAYAQAEDGWKGFLHLFSEDEIYDDMMELLICEGFGARDVFSEKIPASVLAKLYDTCIKKLKYEEDEEFGRYSLIHILQECAHYLKQPKCYIDASKLLKRDLMDRDFIDIAKEYQYAEDVKGTLLYLGKIQSVDTYIAKDFYELQVWAYEVLKQPMNVTLAYKNWYVLTKSPEVLKMYLSRLEGVMQKQAKEEALKDALTLSFSEAMHFFHSLDELELAANYIWMNQGKLETQYLYANELKKIANWLKKGYPQEAILIYRDSCEKALATSHSKNYPSAIKVLKECLKIEKENDTLSWEIEGNMIYMEKLINEHKRKPKFVELFFKAFGDL